MRVDQVARAVDGLTSGVHGETRFHSGPRVAFHAKPARIFTGDFFLVRQDAIGRTWFALGDVAGKGLHAAVLMAMAAEELDLQISRAGAESTVSGLVEMLHIAMRPQLPDNRFVTMVAGRWDSEDSITIVNAGHCPPLLVSARGALRICSHGPVIGPLSGPFWRCQQVHVDPDETLVLYTDGLSEAESLEGRELGEEQIIETLRDGVYGAEGAVNALVDLLERHRGAGEAGDDLTILTMSRW